MASSSSEPAHDEDYAAAQLAQIKKYAHLYPPVQPSEPRRLVNDMVAGSLADHAMKATAVTSADMPPVSGTIEQTSVLKYGLEVREFEWEDDVRVRF